MKDHKVDERTLDLIALTDVSVQDAHALIAEALKDDSKRTAQKICSVMREWVWNALNERRRDAELKQWYKLLQRTSSYLEDRHALEAERLKLLYELVYESISASQIMRPVDIVKRSHVQEILVMLLEERDQTLGRVAISTQLKIKDANLSRVLKLMLASGLVERLRLGRTADFKLTTEGCVQARKLSGNDEARRAEERDEREHNNHLPPVVILGGHGWFDPDHVAVSAKGLAKKSLKSMASSSKSFVLPRITEKSLIGGAEYEFED
ncbi:hypothetical protein [Ensifer sp. Root127]|uniref:hypothetical protein n=1 Tax=Ensifer sp. Root127 TaxID=1736440 RepID=UPI000A99ADB2|nr:hypothetical protein [Ensifer sp. Root127]